MKIIVLGALLLLLSFSGVAVAETGDYVQFQEILNTKCSKCHTLIRIEELMRQGGNSQEILDKMVRFGARITDQERQVLGIFWTEQKPVPPAQAEIGPTVAKDPLGEYRAVLEKRCTGCHSLERVEEAMLQGRSIDELIEMMRKRGAIVTEADKSVLGTFWGNPLKPKLE